MNAQQVGVRRLTQELSLAALVLVAVTPAMTDRAMAADHPRGATASAPRPLVPAEAPDSSPSAEVTFAIPQRVAIISELATKRRRVYASGDLVSDSTTGGQGFQVEAVEPDGIQLRDAPSQKVIRVATGGTIPGLNGRRLAGIATLKGVEYRYTVANDPLDPEPRLIDVREDRAYLEVDITGATPAKTCRPTDSSRTILTEAQPLRLCNRLDARILEKVTVKEIGRDIYDLGAAELRQAMDHAGQILTDAWSTVRPMISLNEGIRFRIQSPVADGVLGPRGFQVSNPNLAERVGIQKGDVILVINGQPINGFSDVFRLYQQVRRDTQISTVTLRLERQGQPLSKTFRVR